MNILNILGLVLVSVIIVFILVIILVIILLFFSKGDEITVDENCAEEGGVIWED